MVSAASHDPIVMQRIAISAARISPQYEGTIDSAC